MSLYLEFFKTKHKFLSLTVLLFIGFQGLWLLWSSRSMTGDELAQGYQSVFYEMPLLNAIVLPILVSVIVSGICETEHRGNCLKALLPYQKPQKLFAAKFFCAAFYLALSILLQLVAFVGIGKWMGFTDPLKLTSLSEYFFAQLAVCLFLALIIQTASLMIANQFLPLILGLTLGFLGLTSMFFSGFFTRLIPSAYFGLLSTMRMDWERETRIIEYYEVPFPWVDLILLLVLFAITYAIGQTLFSKKEV